MCVSVCVWLRMSVYESVCLERDRHLLITEKEKEIDRERETERERRRESVCMVYNVCVYI